MSFSCFHLLTLTGSPCIQVAQGSTLRCLVLGWLFFPTLRKLGQWIVVENRPSHTLSVSHKMISEFPACLNCP
jgi:hypothetical protein